MMTNKKTHFADSYTFLCINLESENVKKLIERANAKEKKEVSIQIDGIVREMTFAEFKDRLLK